MLQPRAERPANGGLLQIGPESLGYELGLSRRQIAESLRPKFGKLPFRETAVGDGFDPHWMVGLAAQLAKVFAIAVPQIGMSWPH